MTTTGFIRPDGLPIIISGLAFGYACISQPELMPPEAIASSGWFWIHVLFAVSLVPGLLGITAFCAVSAQRTGLPGLAGYLSLFVGMMLIFDLDYYEIFIAPFLARQYPGIIVDYGAGDAMGPVAIAFPLSGPVDSQRLRAAGLGPEARPGDAGCDLDRPDRQRDRLRRGP